MMLKTVTFILLLTIPLAVFSEDSNSSYAGVWQDAEKSSDYYVIQENGDSLLLIALPGIESTADTLRYSYIGDKSDLLVTRLSTASHEDIYRQVQLHFNSPTEGFFYPVCEVCGVVSVNIVKVF